MNVYNGKELKTNRWFFALYIGFFAGLIWGAVKIIGYFFKFTTVVPGFLVESFFKHEFLVTWQGYLTGWAFFTLFSIFASFFYMIVLAKLKGPWMGLAYGAIWWAAIYLFVGPLTGMMKWLYQLDSNTIISDFCLFILWGLFIGYSIALEYTEDRYSDSETIFT